MIDFCFARSVWLIVHVIRFYCSGAIGTYRVDLKWDAMNVIKKIFFSIFRD